MAPALWLAPGISAIAPANAQSAAAEPVFRHALSLFGQVKYPAGFKHFDYVNPAAPKGGTVRQIQVGTFDNFNLVVAGVKGSLAAGVLSALLGIGGGIIKVPLMHVAMGVPLRVAAGRVVSATC
jgi:uncharacterized membrane protein YfcA